MSRATQGMSVPERCRAAGGCGAARGFWKRGAHPAGGEPPPNPGLNLCWARAEGVSSSPQEEWIRGNSTAGASLSLAGQGLL